MSRCLTGESYRLIDRRFSIKIMCTRQISLPSCRFNRRWSMSRCNTPTRRRLIDQRLRQLLAADPAAQRLVVHPPATLHAMATGFHAAVLGGEAA